MSNTIRRQKGYQFWKDRSHYHDRFIFSHIIIRDFSLSDIRGLIDKEMAEDKILYESDRGITHNHIKGALKDCFHSRSRAYKRKEIARLLRQNEFNDMHYDFSEELYATKGLIWAFD